MQLECRPTDGSALGDSGAQSLQMREDYDKLQERFGLMI
jgi:hypothetical protein